MVAPKKLDKELHGCHILIVELHHISAPDAQRGSPAQDVHLMAPLKEAFPAVFGMLAEVPPERSVNHPGARVPLFIQRPYHKSGCTMVSCSHSQCLKEFERT